jgi:predicted negative regulator of RcsB-dependent stress response
MRNKIVLIFLVIFIFLKIANARVLVLPFKTVKDVNKSYFWLSNALSFYVSTQLNSINIRAFTEAEITNIMNTKSISYPYRLTKASAIKIGLINHADKIIWGSIKISDSNKSKSEITVHSSIIDTETLKQSFLPVIRGEIKHISLIQDTLFNSIIKKLAPENKNIKNIELDFNNQSYELFIKSLLTKNISDKKHLLINALDLVKNKKDNGAALINFELAVLLFEEGKYENAIKYLNAISVNSSINNRKFFLKSLIYAYQDRVEDAIDSFLKLRNNSNFESCIDNNLGVLCIKSGYFNKAERFLLKSIKNHGNTLTYNNLLNLYLKISDKTKIKKNIVKLLNYFPKNIKYISLLYYMVIIDKNKNELLSVFKDYFDENDLIDYFKLEFKLKYSNPFSVSNKNSIISNYKFDLQIQAGSKQSNDDLFQNMDINPFNYKNHILISKNYIETKQFRKAELYAISAFFLEDSNSNLQNLIDVYKTIGNKNKLKELKPLFKEKDNGQ